MVIRELDENDMGSSSPKQNNSSKALTSERDRELELLKHAHAMSGDDRAAAIACKPSHVLMADSLSAWFCLRCH